MQVDQPEELDERRRALHERADELAARLIQLRRHDHADLEAVERAKDRAAEAIRHGIDAHLRAADAHHKAASAHRQAAEYADRTGHPGRADEHRAAARADDDEAEVHTRAAAVVRAAIQS